MNRTKTFRLVLPGLLIVVAISRANAEDPVPVAGLTVEILEDVPDKRTWEFERPKPVASYNEPAFGIIAVPDKFNNKGLVLDRSNPYMLRAHRRLTLPKGEYRFLLRSKGGARLLIDGKQVVETKFLLPSKASHERVPQMIREREPGIHPLPTGHQEQMTRLELDGEQHAFLLEAYVGGKGMRRDVGELSVCVAGPGKALQLLGSSPPIYFSSGGWDEYIAGAVKRHRERNNRARHLAETEELKYWRRRHEIARREWSGKPGPPVPHVSKTIPVHNAIDAFIGRRLERKNIEPALLVDDYSFLRRVSLDIVGMVPTPKEIRAFFDDLSETRRARVIDRLLEDARWADNWMGYWQDVLAENPALLKPKLNNTGPFRRWIHQSFLDNQSMDRFATELVMMEGSKYGGAPAGFAMATMNDVPMASKAHVVAKAFLGVEMQCARCHDAPYHPYRQEQLFQLGAMLSKGKLVVPKSSTVDLAGRVRRPLVDITLKPGASVAPEWPFHELATAELPNEVLRNPDNSRERLAAILTSPRNERFAQVLVNRLWKRYLGWGIVEPVDDWADVEPSHPELLRFLARELVTHDYNLKHVARLIFNSHTYQRRVEPAAGKTPIPDERLFASPARRRMSAEQVVDSLFGVVGKEFRTEELDLEPGGRRPVTQFMNLGRPRRAWEFTSLSNDRDRPALSMPFAQNVVDVLIVLGWRESRQNPITVRDQTPTVLQPMVLAHGTVGRRIATLSDDSAMTDLCLQQQTLPELVEAVYLRVLCRRPAAREKELFIDLLREGFDSRRVPGAEKTRRPRSVTQSAVSWANHLDPEASRIKLELAKIARAQDPPTKRLHADWRERMEDMLWVLVNSPEFLFIP